MAIGAILGGISLGAGLLGTLTTKTPKYNMSAMNEALALIEKQYGQVEEYFKEAGSAFETQYGTYYGQQVQDAVSSLASRGIYESPVSERLLGRIRTALAETYATGKSQLAGQKMQAISAIDQQKIGYYQNLASIQYQQALAKQQKKAQAFGMLGGVGGALLGA